MTTKKNDTNEALSEPLHKTDVICRLFRAMEGDTEFNSYLQRLPTPMNFDNLKPHICHAFKKGAKAVRLYEDYRKKQQFIEIKKDNFSDSEILEGYETIMKRDRISFLEKQKNILYENIKRNELSLQKIENEIEKLSIV